MARTRTAATAGLVAAGTFLPLLFASPAMAAPGQTFSGTAEANFLTVGAAPTADLTALLAALTLADPTGVSTTAVGDLLDEIDLAAGVELGNATASANAPIANGTTSDATASNLAVDLEALGGGVELSGLDAAQAAPPDNAAPDVASAPVDLGPVLTAGLVTNSASARAIGPDNCPVVPGPLGLGSSALDGVSLLDLGLGTDGLITTGEVTSTSDVSLVAGVPGVAGLATRSTAALDIADLTLFGGTTAETVIDLTGGSLVATVPSGPGAATLVDYTAPTGSLDIGGTGTSVPLAEGTSGTVLLPLIPVLPPIVTAVPSLSVTYTFNTITDADVTAGTAAASILSLTVGVDVDGVGPALPTGLLDLGIGALGVTAAGIDGGITCGTPPVVTPPVVTPPAVNPVATPVRPAALANTGAEPLPMIGLGLGLLAVGGAAMGAGPLRRKLASSADATPSA